MNIWTQLKRRHLKRTLTKERDRKARRQEVWDPMWDRQLRVVGTAFLPWLSYTTETKPILLSAAMLRMEGPIPQEGNPGGRGMAVHSLDGSACGWQAPKTPVGGLARSG